MIAFLKTVYKGMILCAFVVWCLVLMLAVAHFCLENTGTVSLSFYRWQFDAVSIPALVLAMLIVGMVITLLFLLPWLFMMQMRVRRLRVQLAKSQASIKAVTSV